METAATKSHQKRPPSGHKDHVTAWAISSSRMTAYSIPLVLVGPGKGCNDDEKGREGGTDLVREEEPTKLGGMGDGRGASLYCESHEAINGLSSARTPNGPTTARCCALLSRFFIVQISKHGYRGSLLVAVSR